MDYRPEIDGLRAVAVIPVILFHAGFSPFSGGFVGVDVFFVISGYLIATIILAELTEGKFSIINFYERRARRILPALFVVLLFSIPLAWLWLPPQDMKGFSQSLVAVSLFVSNVMFWQTSGYFDTAAELKPLLHTWSLAVEEQYYLILPVFLILTWRLRKRWIMVLLAVVAVVSLTGAQWGAMHYPAAAFYLLPTRGWELLIGFFVAFYFSREHKWQTSKAINEVGGAVGLMLLSYAVFAFKKETPFPSLYTLFPTIGTALIILCASQQTAVGKLLSHKLFVGVGLISYSAYLWHQPLFSFARHRSLGEPSTLMFIELVVATTAISYLSWKYIEIPCRDKERFSRKQIFVYGAVGSTLFVALGFAGHFTEGFRKQRLTDKQLIMMKTAAPSPKRAECHAYGANYQKAEAACEYHTGTLKWAVLGDSHSVELAYGLANALKISGTKLKHFSFSGCVPAHGRTEEGSLKYCADWTKQAVEYIVQNKDIQNVVVSYRIHAELFGTHQGKYPSLPKEVSSADREKRWASYLGLLQHLVKKGKKVILVLQAPELPKSIEVLLFREKNPLGPITGVSREWWTSRSNYVISRMGEIPHEVIVVDPAKLFCDDLDCMAGNNGVAYYFDDHHLSISGAHLIADAIINSAVQ